MTTGVLAERRTTGVGFFDSQGAATWLLLGPCVLYLVAFAIYPLFYSLRLSFTDLTAADATAIHRAAQLSRPDPRPLLLDAALTA